MTKLDPIIHVGARLKIMAALAELGIDTSMTFPALQKTLNMTAGNLSVHIHKLSNAGYVVITKGYRANKPTTYAGITLEGKAAYTKYIATLKEIIGVSIED